MPKHTDEFQFNKDLDTAFLNALFEGDLAYAEVVFGEFLKDMPVYWKDIEEAYAKRNMRELIAATHKCKTLFGYVGCTDTQEVFQQFENKYAETSDQQQLQKDFAFLATKKESAHQLVDKEYSRLEHFNQTNETE